MTSLHLRSFHEQHGAQFGEINGKEMVRSYGTPLDEYRALRNTVAWLDRSYRSRLVLTGPDRTRFLNGQVTNDVAKLKVGEGCYAALITAKGKMDTDLFVYNLGEELLLDFEPGYSEKIKTRLERFIIADQVEVIDATDLYGCLTLMGPAARNVIETIRLAESLPETPSHCVRASHPDLGECYLAFEPQFNSDLFNVFAPKDDLETLASLLNEECSRKQGSLAGWDAIEILRIEAGVPRFGQDMNESNLPPEAGIESRAISYSKGCYTGQEVIARIRTYGQVAKSLRGLLLPPDLTALPEPGTKLTHQGKEIGYITSAVHSPGLSRNIGLGYLRKEIAAGDTVTFLVGDQPAAITVAALPFNIASEP